MQYLKANTAADVLIGPFVDDTDGKTAETALTLSQADIKLSKNGQTLAQKNDATAASHDANGYYNCELDATDTNTEGTLVLIVAESGALPVRHEFNVLCEAAYDSLFAAKDTGYMDVDVKAISTSTTAADNAEIVYDTDFATNYSTTNDKWQTEASLESINSNAAAAGQLRRWLTSWASGTVQSDGGTSITLDAGGSAVDDFYNGDLLMIFAGTGNGQAATILDYNGTSKVATIDRAFSTTLSTDSDYIIIPSGGVSVEAINGNVSVITNMEDFFNGTGYDASASTIGTVTTLTNKTGFSLASDGMDSVTLPADIITAASINTGAFTADAFAADALVAATFATDSIAADALAADAIAEINATVDTALSDYGANTTTPPTAAAIADAVWLEAIADHSSSSGSTAEALNAAGSAGDPWTTALPGAYGAGSAGYIIGNNLDAAASTLATASALETVDGIVDNILDDTNELQTNQGNWLTATSVTVSDKTGFSLAADQSAVTIGTVTTVTNMRGTDSAMLATEDGSSFGSIPDMATASAQSTIAGYLDTEIAAIKAVTDNLPNSGALTDLATAANLAAAQSDLDTITDTGVTAVALTSAAAADVWSTDALTEAYPADGAAGTPAELLYLILSVTSQFIVSSTTLTAYKLDGSTTAATYTLDDDTNPTKRTRTG